MRVNAKRPGRVRSALYVAAAIGVFSLFVFGLFKVAWPMSPSYVLIDSSEEAYTVFLLYPPKTTEQQIEQFIAKYAADGLKASILPMEEFAAATKQNVEARIIKNDYPQVKIADGLASFLKGNPGAPVGLTWNGGIAVTKSDYAFAKKAYARYKSNPTEYEHSRPKDRSQDPLHPLNH